jgi:iron(III) transport system substrate-binding protein
MKIFYWLALIFLFLDLTPAISADWNAALAGAKKEGTVVVAGAPGTAYREAMEGFRTKFPYIQLRYEGLNPRDFTSRFATERRAGQFLWDVYITGPTSFDITAKKAGDLLPVRPALLLPEVRDEHAWFGGFKKAFLDSEKQYVFAFQAEVTPQAYINRDAIPKSDLDTIKGMLNPKWKGKIAIHDPRVDGAGNGRIAAWTGLLGEEFVRALLQQDVVLTNDYRQLAEWLVRGRYPIAIGTSGTDLYQFKQEGVGLNVEPLGGKAAEAWRLSTGFGAVRLISKAPNPNAAIIFLNWLLSKEGQTAWVTKAGRPSRRTDVPRVEGQSPEPGIDYFDIDREETVPLRDKAKKIAAEVLR